MTITNQNRDTFVSVVAWVLILYGLSSGYGLLSQLVTRFLLFSVGDISVTLLTVLVVGLFFSTASLWCGLGLRKRQRSRLKAFIVLLWLYIAWSIGFNVWNYYLFVDQLSSLGMPVSESLKMQFVLASTVSESIKVILLSALFIWLIRQFSTDLVQEEFEG